MKFNKQMFKYFFNFFSFQIGGIKESAKRIVDPLISNMLFMSEYLENFTVQEKEKDHVFRRKLKQKK